MKKAVIFGASGTGMLLYPSLKEQYDIIYATDNDPVFYNKVIWGGITVKDKAELSEKNYDCVVIASVSGLDEIYNQLIDEFKLNGSMIIRKHAELFVSAKNQFVESFAKIVYEKDIKGSVAEVGVFRGEFAKEINRVFHDRTLYLFDTFGGYDQRDIERDIALGYRGIENETILFKDTTPELVLQKLPSREKAVIKKGHFPETFDLLDEAFCFINLDINFYSTTLAALKLFYPLISKGGIILVHDYFSPYCPGVKAATDEFTKEHAISFMPIGDFLSIAIIK